VKLEVINQFISKKRYIEVKQKRIEKKIIKKKTNLKIFGRDNRENAVNAQYKQHI